MPSKRHIIISADGGLGDHVTAEPAIRYLLEHFLKNDDVRIAAHWPRVFEHLGVPVHKHNTFDPGTVAYETRWTFFNHSDPLWRAVCFLMVHMVDYMSLNLMQRTLPFADREIKLVVNEGEHKSLKAKLGTVDPKKLIAVHAGKSWQTKTFPPAWWQEVVNKLSAEGYVVCLFGQSASPVEGDKTGVVTLECPRGGVDLRDKLSVGELFALLEYAPVLLTNDSSPVQIAGAFDNHIVVIATIKHPDYLLPYRKGSPHYKAKALYKTLIADEIFETLDLSKITVDFPITNWEKYLPEPNEVVSEIKKLL